MKLKYPLFTTIFFATTPLLAADAMDAVVPSLTSTADDVVATIPQESSREWTHEQKMGVFRDVQATLTPYNLRLNQEEVIGRGCLKLDGKLSNFLPDIQGFILTEICKFTWLKKLNLYFNGLTALPPEIGALTQLTKLNLFVNQLTALPPEIGALTQLTELDLSRNKLTALPPEIMALKQLKNLFFSSNDLTVLPSQIWSLTQLKELYLDFNQLTELPPQIGALIQLQRLDLSENQLIALPPEIGLLTQLQRLGLMINQLTELPVQISALTHLQRLDLFQNRLTALPPQISALTHLQRLDLFQNRLTELPVQISALTHLQRLDLSANQLTALPPQIRLLTHLQRLDLPNNQLTALPPEIGLLTQLTELLLASNRLMTLPASIRHIRALTLFDLQRNPLLPTGETPEEWGRQRLREHFGDRLLISGLSLENMPDTTTAGEVYGALDVQNLRLNREKFTALRLPDIKVEAVFLVDEMLEALNQIIGTLNLTNEQGEAYLSYEILANDFASDGTARSLTNVEKIKAYLMPRLTGYIRGLYGVPLAPTDIRPWTMYAAQIPETQKTLTYLLEKIRDAGDVDRQALLFYQLVNGLLHCPTGQAEGINAVAYALAEGAYRVNDFVGRISHHLAVKKNTAFTQSILTKGAESTQNTHLISFYRDLLKEKLGLTAAIASFTERLGTCGADPFGGNQWNVVKVFYDVVTPHRLLDWVMGLCETAEDKQNQQALREQEAALFKHLTNNYDEICQKIQKLKATIKKNSQFRFLTTGLICGYLSDQKLIGDEDEDEDDNWWQAYFTADPTLDESARITRDGMMNILVHMGLVIRD